MPRFPHFPASHARPWLRRPPDKWDFPLLHRWGSGLLDHRNTLVLCLRIPSCGLCSVPRSLRWKINAEYYLHIITRTRPVPKSIFRRRDEFRAGCFFKQMVTKDVEQIRFYISAMVPWCGCRSTQVLKCLSRALPVLEDKKKGLSVFLTHLTCSLLSSHIKELQFTLVLNCLHNGNNNI